MIGTPTIYFDTDDTLVCWEMHNNPNAIPFICYGKEYKLVPHTEHIKMLKKFKADGFQIVVWSAGGREWVEEVVNKLFLNDYVDVMLSKPSFYVDDVEVRHFMHKTKRLYIPYENE